MLNTSSLDWLKYPNFQSGTEYYKHLIFTFRHEQNEIEIQIKLADPLIHRCIIRFTQPENVRTSDFLDFTLATKRRVVNIG